MTQPATPEHGQLQELLEICENFFAHMSLATSNELDLLLRARGVTGGPGWLIDMLGSPGCSSKPAHLAQHGYRYWTSRHEPCWSSAERMIGAAAH